MPTDFLTGLECSACHQRQTPDRLHNLCPHCQKPLLARYDLERAAQTLRLGDMAGRPASMWRYREVMPARRPLSLGEGWTPLLPVRDYPHLLVKDEALNPTGSFKARGLSAAVSMAVELGAKGLVIPSAGNAAGAMSAYAAQAGLPAHVFMPADVPAPFRIECEVLGATVTLVDGLITDCGARARAAAQEHGWFDVSTLKEPYRVEGKKTLGYELFEQLGRLPDVVIYPTGGGTGMVGMWKAFQEMEAMGWIDGRRPRMVSVQSTGCAPIVRAFEQGDQHAAMWEGARTVADGLRVPAAVGDFLILQAVRESSGTAVAIADADLLQGARTLSRLSGTFAAPEGGACMAAYLKLRNSGWLRDGEQVVLFNTGTGLKYHHAFA
ncbi:MAG TPA: threonine synthase [Candidatus Xenobia bacterium]|jgi:threonine synthase